MTDIMNELTVKKSFQQQVLADRSQPFTGKQPVYLAAFKRLLRSRNGACILECGGDEP